MEKCGNLGSGQGKAPGVLRACSACAGDYEDPDRTAWGDDEGGRDDGDDDDDAMRYLADAGRACADDEVSAGKHFSAVAAFAKSAARRLSAGQTLPCDAKESCGRCGPWRGAAAVPESPTSAGPELGETS